MSEDQPDLPAEVPTPTDAPVGEVADESAPAAPAGVPAEMPAQAAPEAAPDSSEAPAEVPPELTSDLSLDEGGFPEEQTQPGAKVADLAALPSLDDADTYELISFARQARENAYAPYSRFAVGAAIRARDGRVFIGANMENSSFGASICAERAALAAANTAGVRDIVAVAVVSGSSPPAPPCGLCRQSLVEFVRDAHIILVNEAGEQVSLSLAELHPRQFREIS